MAKDKKKRGQRKKKKKRERKAASRWYTPQNIADKADDGFLALARGLGVASRYVGDGASSTVAGAGRILSTKKDAEAGSESGETQETTSSAEAASEPSDRIESQDELVRSWEDAAVQDLPELGESDSEPLVVSDPLESLANLADDDSWTSGTESASSDVEAIAPESAEGDSAEVFDDEDSSPKRRWWDEWKEDEVPRYLKSNIEDAQWDDEGQGDEGSEAEAAAPETHTATESDDIFQALDDADYFDDGASDDDASDDRASDDLGSDYSDDYASTYDDDELQTDDVFAFDGQADLPASAEIAPAETEVDESLEANADSALDEEGTGSVVKVPRLARRAISVHTLMRRYPAKNKVESIRLRAAVDDLLNGSEVAKSRALRVLAARGAEAAPFLVAALTTASNPVAREAIEWLVEVLDADQLPALLLDLLSARNVELRLLALPGIPRLSPAHAKLLLMKASRDGAGIVRRRTISFLSWQPSSWAMAEIRRLCDDIDLGVKMAALEALIKIRPNEARLMVQKVLDSGSSTHRRLASALLRRYDPANKRERPNATRILTATPPASAAVTSLPAAAPSTPAGSDDGVPALPIIHEPPPRAAAKPPVSTEPAEVEKLATPVAPKPVAKAQPAVTRGSDRRKSAKRKKTPDRRKASKAGKAGKAGKARPRVKD